MATSLNLHFRLESVGPPDESNWRESRLRFLRICDWSHARPAHLRVRSPQRLPAVLAWRSVQGYLVVVQGLWIRLGESGDPLVFSQHAAGLPFEFEASLKAVRVVSEFLFDPSELFRIECRQSSVPSSEHPFSFIRLQHRNVHLASPAPDHFHSLPPTGNLPTALRSEERRVGKECRS